MEKENIEISDNKRKYSGLKEYQNRLKEICENYETDPMKILEFMQFKSRFYKYSLNNTALIYDQRPGATFVQSYDNWNRMQTRIKKGEHGIKIFVPIKKKYILNPENGEYLPASDVKKKNPKLYGQALDHPDLNLIDERISFRMGNVFDISQTDFPKEKYPQLLHVGYSSEQHDQLIKGVLDFAKKDLGISVTTENLESISVRGISYSGRQHIKINQILESTQYLSTLNHEIGHQLMHNNSKKPESVKEFEADAFSIMMDYYMGIDVLDTRKTHFVQAYERLRQHPDFENKSFEELFSDVFKTYSMNAEAMDIRIQPYMNRNISRRIRHRHMEVPIDH